MKEIKRVEKALPLLSRQGDKEGAVRLLNSAGKVRNHGLFSHDSKELTVAVVGRHHVVPMGDNMDVGAAKSLREQLALREGENPYAILAMVK